MKKIYMLLTAIGSLILFTTGCGTTQNIKLASAVIEQGAYVGTTYAIEQNTNNVKYFVLADATLRQFVLGADLSPTAFENALMDVAPQLNNQWVQLGVNSIIVIYDAAYDQYVIGQITNNVVAREFITAADNGIYRAIQPYLPAGTTLKIVSRVAKCPRPSVVAPKFK